MIKRKYIIPQTVEVFNPRNKSLGIFNEYEFVDLLIQICKSNTSGYSLIFDGVVYNIDNNGSIENHPKGLFYAMGDLYSNLVEERCSK